MNTQYLIKAGIILLFQLMTIGCTNISNQGSREENIKYEQYLNEGKRLYTEHCSNCHQRDGSGLAKLYPPLKNSDFLQQFQNQVICGIKYGQTGEIRVNGILYNQPMPENLQLTNLEIAEITTYIYSQWGNINRRFTHAEIDSILTLCKPHYDSE